MGDHVSERYLLALMREVFTTIKSGLAQPHCAKQVTPPRISPRIFLHSLELKVISLRNVKSSTRKRV